MVKALSIDVERASHSGISKVDFKNLTFGKTFTDHMFIADCRSGEWKNLRVLPYGYMPISPASPSIHYGQAIFEGLKAYRGPGGEALLFRPHDNWMRLNNSAERMALAHVPEEIFMEGIRALLELDRAWIPDTKGSSLYIRPFLFSADEFIGIKPSQDFTFMIINSPTGSYYSSPVKVKIETHFTRAVEGGTGYAKAAGNYAGSIYPARLAAEQGYHQLIWTDGKTHEFIEESGTMNVMFVINDVLTTPALSDSILAGITRDSLLKLARHWGIKVEERKVSVKEVVEGIQKGTVKEAFGTGTAATVAPIQSIGYEGIDYALPASGTNGLAARFLDELEAIKHGQQPDPFNWVVRM